MLPFRNWRSWAAVLALLAYPRAFRRRFGTEVRADIRRDLRTTSPARFVGLLATHISDGLAERGSAVAPWMWWPTHRFTFTSHRLLIRSFMRLMDVDPRFRPESLLTLQMNIPDRLVSEPNRPISDEQRRAFYEDLLDRLEAIPGVVAVGGTTRIPLGSSSVTTALHVEGREPTGQLPEVSSGE